MDDFEKVYGRLVAYVEGTSRGKLVDFEHPSMVQQDTTALSKDDLLKLEGDDVFVRNCFYKLLGRNPSANDVRGYSNELSRGGLTREGLIDKILESPEYEKKAINVRLV